MKASVAGDRLDNPRRWRLTLLPSFQLAPLKEANQGHSGQGAGDQVSSSSHTRPWGSCPCMAPEPALGCYVLSTGPSLCPASAPHTQGVPAGGLWGRVCLPGLILAFVKRWWTLASCVSTPQSLRLIPWDVASVCSLPPPPSMSPVPILLQVQLSSALPPAHSRREADIHSPPPGVWEGAAPHMCSPGWPAKGARGAQIQSCPL